MRGQRILRALMTPLTPVCELRKGAAAEVTWGGVCSPTTFVALVPGRFVGLVQLEEPATPTGGHENAQRMFRG